MFRSAWQVWHTAAAKLSNGKRLGTTIFETENMRRNARDVAVGGGAIRERKETKKQDTEFPREARLQGEIEKSADSGPDAGATPASKGSMIGRYDL